MKDFFIEIYSLVLGLLLIFYIIGGLFISYFTSALWNYGRFDLSIFLIGLLITFASAGLVFGLLFIQLQNNELLKEIRTNTNQRNTLEDIKVNTNQNNIVEKNNKKNIKTIVEDSNEIDNLDRNQDNVEKEIIKSSVEDSSEINNLDQNQEVEKTKFLDSAYQSYLVQKYDIDIRKNNGKYVFQNKSYNSLLEVYEEAYKLDLLEDQIKE